MIMKSKKSTKKIEKDNRQSTRKKLSPGILLPTKSAVKKSTKKSKTVDTETKTKPTKTVAKKKTMNTNPKAEVSIKHSRNTENEVEPKRRRKQRTPKSKMYFTQDTEDAIVLFNITECEIERNKIYNERILQPFRKLAENIFNTFKFSYYDTFPQDVQDQVVSELTHKINKYKPQSEGGGKAFSYFSIIAKNWLILHNNNTFKKWKQHTEILDSPEEDTSGEILSIESDNIEEVQEFIELMIDYWDENLTKVFVKRKELEIANAVLELFRNSERLENFNKKALYLYIREISGCKTQNITKVINKMKDYQQDIYREYINHGVVTMYNKGETDTFFDEY